jgi:hypothetical protein
VATSGGSTAGSEVKAEGRPSDDTTDADATDAADAPSADS